MFPWPAAAARPVKGARYAGLKPDPNFNATPGLAWAVLQVSRDGRRLRRGSYIHFASGCADRGVRLAPPRGPRVRVRRSGRFDAVRNDGMKLRLRGRFKTNYTAGVLARLRYRSHGRVCDSGRVRLTLHRAGEPPFGGCRSERATTLATGATGRIFLQRRLEGLDYLPFAYGCLYATNRRISLGLLENEPIGQKRKHFRLSGPYAASYFDDCSDEFACVSDISVLDLRDGKKVRTTRVGVPSQPHDVTDLELKDSGAVAWIETTGANTRSVLAFDALGRRGLDADPLIDLTSLTLTGSTLTWLKAGTVQSAMLQ